MIFLTTALLLSVAIRLSVQQHGGECSALPTEERIYVDLSLTSRMFNKSPHNETLLPRPLLRGRRAHLADQRMDFVLAILSVLEEHSPLLVRYQQVLDQVRADICQYVNEQFEVNCDDMDQITTIIKLRSLITSAIVAFPSPSHYNPTCDCLKDIIQDNSLLQIAVSAINALGCQVN